MFKVIGKVLLLLINKGYIMSVIYVLVILKILLNKEII